MSAGFRPKVLRELVDSNGATFTTVTATPVYSESVTPRGDYFGLYVRAADISGEVLSSTVEISYDEGTNWIAMPISKGMLASSGPGDAALPDINANGAEVGAWEASHIGYGSPNVLVRFKFVADTGTITLSDVKFFEGSLGGR